MRSTHNARSVRLRRRGTASVEVVMMLPFFIIVYAGLYWMYGHYMGRQQAMLRARSCTWAYAARGCRDKDIYDACMLAPSPSLEPDAQAKGEVEETNEPILSSGASKPEDDGTGEEHPQTPLASSGPSLQGESEKNSVGSSTVGSVMNKFEKVPIIGDALHYLFGTPVKGKAKQYVNFGKPAIKPYDVIVKGDYTTLCNTVPKDWKKVAKDIFCGFLNNKFPGC